MTSGTISTGGTIRRQSYLILVLVALAARLARILIIHSYIIPLVQMHPPMSSGDPHFSFGFEIGSIAHSIATGHGFGSPFGPITGPTAWIAPLYPYLAAAVFKIFGVFTPASAFVLFFLNSLFSALTCIPICRIGERIMSPAVGICSGWAWALVPYFWTWPTTEIWETSLVALLLTFLVLLTLQLAEPTESSGTRVWLIFGFLWGVALLTNPALLTFLPVSFLCLVYRRRKEGAPALRSITVAIVICALVVAPWLVRNRVVFGQPIFIRSNFGFEFHLGNYHLSNGFGWAGKHPSANKEEREQYARMGEIAYVAAKRDEAMTFVRQYPREFLELTAKRMYAFWAGGMIDYGGRPLLPWLYGPFALLTLFGWLFATREKIEGQGLLLGLLLLFPLPFYVAFPQARNRHAIEPEMLVLSMYFLMTLVPQLRTIWQKPQAQISERNP